MVDRKWRPIKTAPRNGESIEVYCGNAEFPICISHVQFRKPDELYYVIFGAKKPNISLDEVNDKKGFFPGWGLKLQGNRYPTKWRPMEEKTDVDGKK